MPSHTYLSEEHVITNHGPDAESASLQLDFN